MDCPLCVIPTGLRGVTKMAFLATDLCVEHLAVSGIPAYEASHPFVGNERPCTVTCGCLSHAEMVERLGEGEGEA